LRTEEALSAKATNWSTTTPLSRRTEPTTITAQPTARAARAPIHRSSNSAIQV
jgi:hypothetical protein